MVVKASGRPADPLAALVGLLAAGIDPARALAIAADGADARNARRLRAVARGLEDGSALPDLLAAQGLVAPAEAGPVRALAATGRIDQALEWLVAERGRAHGLRRRLRAGLVLPAAVLVVAAVAGPLPAAFAGTLGAGGYLLAVVRPLAGAALLAWAGFRLAPRGLAAFRRLRLRAGNVASPAERERLFHLLARLLGGGLPAAEALATCASGTDGPLAERLAAAAGSVRAGGGLVAALAAQRLLAPAPDRAWLDAGESAGRLAATFDHAAGELAERRALREHMIAEWVPRAVYVLALFTALGHIL